MRIAKEEEMEEMEEVRMFPRKGSQQSTSPGALFCPALRVN